jgi:hypothetical protein
MPNENIVPHGPKPSFVRRLSSQVLEVRSAVSNLDGFCFFFPFRYAATHDLIALLFSPLSLQNVQTFKGGVTFGSGDFVSLFSLFFDNLSTLLGFSGAILGLSEFLAFDASKALLEEILFNRIVPAAGIMLFVGNVFYTWQAIRLAKKYQRAYTAQPYGLNTAGGFPFIFGIIYGVFSAWQCEGETCTEAEEIDRVTTSWKVCVSANFLCVSPIS